MYIFINILLLLHCLFLFSHCENIRNIILTEMWNYVFCIPRWYLTWTSTKTTEKVINRIFIALTINMEFNSLKRKDYILFCREKAQKPQSLNKFHIKRQNIEIFSISTNKINKLWNKFIQFILNDSIYFLYQDKTWY